MTTNLTSATSATYRTVNLVFDYDLGNPAEYLSVTSYQISGLAILGVVALSATSVRLYTTAQVQDKLYTVSVVGALVDIDGDPISTRTAGFTGTGATAAFVVSNLSARTCPEGGKIHLTWTNPNGHTRLRILRRQKAWPFDLVDDAYIEVARQAGGNPVEFFDTGVASNFLRSGGTRDYYDAVTAGSHAAGVSSVTVNTTTGLLAGDYVRIDQDEKNGQGILGESVKVDAVTSGSTFTTTTPLVNTYAANALVRPYHPFKENTFYYYTVIVESGGSYGTSPDITNTSRTFALVLGSSFDAKAWLWSKTPKEWRKRDAQPTTEGGGDGFLYDFMDTMAAQLKLLHGLASSIPLVADDDEAPQHVLEAKIRSLGDSLEGDTFDFDATRRHLRALGTILANKGNCTGAIALVKAITQWTIVCTELGFGSCSSGPSPFRTYDGVSKRETRSGTSSIITSRPEYLEDTNASWTVDEWVGGQIRGWLGDHCCILSNTATTMVLRAPTPVALVTTLAVAGSSTIFVDDITFLRAGMNVQITDRSVSPAVGEISEIVAIDESASPYELTLRGPSEPFHAFPVGSEVSIEKSMVRKEMTLGVTFDGINPMAADYGRFVENQWGGYEMTAQAGKTAITSNGDAELVGATPVVAGAEEAAIAYLYDAFTSYAGRNAHYKYKLCGGEWSFLVDAVADRELIGTEYDPFYRLLEGPGFPLLGAWSSGDIGLYVQNSVPAHMGFVTAAPGSPAVLDIDPGAVAPAVNALVGYYLNPNQNQEQMLEIVSNTATTITVIGNIESLAVVGQVYYVLKPRDRNRYIRVIERLKKKFFDGDVRVHLLFF